MGICPNCGSWVDEGDICNCCGGSNYSYEDESEDEYDSHKCYRKAVKLRKKGEYHEALDLLSEFLEKHYDAKLWNLKGNILGDITYENPDARYSQSVKCYDKALLYRRNLLFENNKAICLCDWAWHLINIGYYHQAMDKIDEAIPLYEKKDLDYAYALNAKGVIYNRLNNYEKAMEYYDLALKYDPLNEIYMENKRNYETAIDARHR